MSQLVFKNPFVSVASVTTGAGNGTVSVDKLTHFTIAQIYTLTCVASSPDTTFSVSGSLDGSVGIATAGTQFFDQDLKVFLTIQQGSTPFAVGDQIVFTVANGTDLNQQNIDTYDELPQKNFGVGLLGTVRGDHNVRFSNTARAASLYLQDLLFTAVTAGSTGDAVSMQYASAINPLAASLVAQDLTFTAVTPGTGGNSITFEYLPSSPALPASVNIQDVAYTAFPGAAGNSISVAYTTGATAGAEVVSVTGNAVSVQIQSGVSTASQIISAVNASGPAMALFNTVALVPLSVGTTAQTAPVSATFLAGGADSIGLAGSEIVAVSGNAISVTMESGVSTATQIKAKLDAYAPATALISTTITGSGSNTQTTSPSSPTNLAGGTTGTGYTAPSVSVTSNAILVYVRSGVASATDVKTALDGSTPAAALITTAIIGAGSDKQYSPFPATFLSGGRNKQYAFNHNEQSDSSNFVEGNGNILAKDLTLLGKAKITGHVEALEALSLNNQTPGNLSGAAVPDVQQYLNNLIDLGEIVISTATSQPLTWSGTALTFPEDIHIDFPTLSIRNTLLASNSPVNVSDGFSVYLQLNPTLTSVVGLTVGATMPHGMSVMRLCTREGSTLVWFNGTSLAATETARVGTVGSISTNLANSIVRRDSSGDFAAHNIAANQVTATKVLVGAGSGNGLDVQSAGDLEVGASVGAHNLWLGGTTSTVVVKGNFEVQGTTTTVDSATLTVVDPNITINHGGNDTTAEGSGLSIERVGTYGSLIYKNAAASRFEIGDLGSEKEVADISSTQTLTNKTQAVGSNHITSTPNRAAQFNTSTGDLEPSSVNDTELGYVSGVTSGIQTQLNDIIARTRAGVVALSSGALTGTVTFSSAFGSTNYRIAVTMINTIDGTVQFQPLTVTAKSTSGFTVSFNAATDSANYSVEYIATLDN